MKRFMSNIWRFIRLFFHFRKPAFESMEVCNLVVQQKPILLIGWKNRYRYSVHVKAAKFNNYQLQGIHLLKVSSQFNEVVIVLRSAWRSTYYKMPVYSIWIPPEVLAEILSQPDRLRTPAVNDFHVTTAITVEVKKQQIESAVFSIQTVFPRIEVKSFTYEQP